MSLPIPADELRMLLKCSDGPGLRRLAVHLGLIGVAAAGVWHAMALLGLFEILLLAPLHEATHGPPFRSRWAARLVGAIAAHRKDQPPFHNMLATLDWFGWSEFGEFLGLGRDRVAWYCAPDTS